MLYVIHQAGKVASQTLEVTIAITDRSAHVSRHHYLEPSNLAEVERLCAEAPPGPQVDSLRMQAGRGVAALLTLAQTDPRDVFVLSGFRDPLDFAISAFFQNLEYFCADYSSPGPGEAYDSARFDGEVVRVMELFKNEFSAFLERTRAGLAPRNIHELEVRRKFQNLGEWFDREFKPIFGVDLFALDIGSHPFIRFNSNRGQFLIYRMESFRENLPAIVSQLPLPEPIKIANQNLSEDKAYATLYKRFRECFTATPEMMEYYYGGRFFHHFYSGSQPRYRVSSGALT